MKQHRPFHPSSSASTPTNFLGVPTYQNNVEKQHTSRATPVFPVEYGVVFRTHFDRFDCYLVEYLAKAPPGSRATARQKLSRLTPHQFHELSTDVYDELVRRQEDSESPFLPVKEGFHPKRNQARQKLATLPCTRFQDLLSDVHFELARRYPGFKEDFNDSRASTGSDCDDHPLLELPSVAPPPMTK